MLYRVHYRPYIVCYTGYITEHGIRCMLYRVHYRPYIVCYTGYITDHTLYVIQGTLQSIHCMLYRVHYRPYIVCSVCCSHNLVILAPFMTYHKIFIKCNMTGALSGAGTSYPYGAPE